MATRGYDAEFNGQEQSHRRVGLVWLSIEFASSPESCQLSPYECPSCDGRGLAGYQPRRVTAAALQEIHK